MRYGSDIEVGQRFGRLTVTRIYFPRRSDQARIECLCDCGTSLDTIGGRLRAGGKKSCGCYRRDRAGQLYRKHGKSHTPPYVMFYDARKRAQRFGVPFDIEPDDIHIPAVCAVLGIALDGSSRDRTPSLDRIVPTKGYVRGNIRVISFRANRIKSDASTLELRAILAYMEAAS